MKEKFQKSQNDEMYVRTSPMKRLILLVAFTAIMLIASTYAWFSVQNDVTISGITGTVESVAGLMISLDAKNWTHELDLSQNGVKAHLDSGYDLANPYGAGANNAYPAGANLLSTELVPVSTDGSAVGETDILFYRGEYDGENQLIGINEVVPTVEDPEDMTYPGYVAIDLYLQNASQKEITVDPLKLAAGSSISISGEESTGLQDTARVGLALYTPAADDEENGISTEITAKQSEILKAYNGATISDVAIWEPNANEHTDWVVETNNSLILADADKPGEGWTVDTTDETVRNGKFGTNTILPTYALSATSLTAAQVNSEAGSIADIYDWKTIEGTGLTKQVTLQTNKEATPGAGTGKKENLKNVNGSTFDLPANKVAKVRVYLWLEGQDVDTINKASHGGTVTINIGLTKGETWVSANDLYESGDLQIGDFVNYDAGTWTADEIAAIQTGTVGSLVTANGSTVLPSREYQFGGFAADSSRNGNATPYDTKYNYIKDETGNAVTGWRVFDIEDDGTVTLISAGNPEDYYHPGTTNSAYISEYILTGNKNSNWTDADTSLYQQRDWSDYVNEGQKATSATALTKSRLDSWYSKYMGVANADTYTNDTFRQIYAEPYLKYQSIVDNYSYYWLSAANVSDDVYYVNPYSRYVGHNFDRAFGVRVLVSLSSGVQFSDASAGTKTLSGGNMATYDGSSHAYNIWNIK